MHRDGDEVVIGSRTGKPLTRYFPELVTAVRENLPPRCVIDGEVVVVYDGRLDFDRLSERIHPADSRVRLLAEQTPASLVAFDILAVGDDSLLGTPQVDRRAVLEAALSGASAPVHLAPATTDPAVAQEWFERYEGAGLDGVVAKPLDLPYRPDVRVMYKIKHERTADCVVAGYRFHKSGPIVGSLLLGLYDSEGVLQHVGGVRRLPDEAPRGTRDGAGATADRLRRPSVGGLGRRHRARDRPAARCAEPVVHEEGPVVGGAASGAGVRGGVRPHGGRPVPAHCPVPPVAAGPHPRRLHVCAAGGGGGYDLAEVLSAH